ncbi:hypothetical protein BT63DRAFT_415407 [Microthyrium microscopicum]|uniref:60S ribosomal protein L35 n=1 Tax=Microthyrium microscopicum TaxID=703497 RepID=A0A6A6U9U2_9PEZI|nr:hypothetical protein BT63DRAFT_415407 [Microthyrium microscopicum]
MSAGKVKTSSLWGKSKDDLMKQLKDMRQELVQLRTQKVAGGASAKLNRITDVRKAIARILTIINANQRAQLRLFYQDKKHKPLDLRPRVTRAMRRRLTPAEAALKTTKAKKRESHFPARNFAIKAEV